DPRNMWDGINGGGGSGARELGPLLNQYLVAIKPDGNAEPRLLVEQPSQANGQWVVNPDGTMQVTYKLRPGVTWHDGTPFTAEDMVFSWQVDRDPAIPSGNQSSVKLIKTMEAIDPQTAVATWSQTYPFADRMEEREFYPVPAHLLTEAFAGDKQNFVGRSYFSDDYIGLGPYKLTQWEHGSAMDMAANDAFFL